MWNGVKDQGLIRAKPKHLAVSRPRRGIANSSNLVFCPHRISFQVAKCELGIWDEKMHWRMLTYKSRFLAPHQSGFLMGNELANCKCSSKCPGFVSRRSGHSEQVTVPFPVPSGCLLGKGNVYLQNKNVLELHLFTYMLFKIGSAKTLNQLWRTPVLEPLTRLFFPDCPLCD